MRNFLNKTLNKAGISFVALITLLVGGGLGTTSAVLASSTSNFTQVINPGTLTIDIVDGSYATVSSPSVAMSAVTVGFSCQTSTGTFGTPTQQVYIKDPGATFTTSWSATLAASAPTALWASTIHNTQKYDFNDPTTGGCADGADTDTYAGQLTVNPSVATLAKGNCLSCSAATGMTKGSSAAFSEGVVDSITLLTAGTTSSPIGDWTLQGITLSQKIPAEQPAATDYAINFTLSIVVS